MTREQQLQEQLDKEEREWLASDPHIGEVHGVCTIIERMPERDKYGSLLYKCKCNECGYTKIDSYSRIKLHCAKICKHIKSNGEYIRTDYQWTNQRIGKIFSGITTRCYNPNEKSYKWYGGKGIKICDEWNKNPILFEKWALENGYQDDLTIDRIDPNKDYSPENCRWITLKENSRRAGNVNWITINEETLTGRQWGEKIGVGLNTINRFIRECGIDKTAELIKAILKDPDKLKQRKSKQSYFNLYGIEIS